MFFNQLCFCLQILKSANQDATKKKTTKNWKWLIASLQECKVVKNEELDRRGQSITQYEQVVSVIKDFELLIRQWHHWFILREGGGDGVQKSISKGIPYAISSNTGY